MIDIRGDLGGWAPGANPDFLPEGIGRILPKGSDLVIQVHYHPSGKPEAGRQPDRPATSPRRTSRSRRPCTGGPPARCDFAMPAGEPRLMRSSPTPSRCPVDVDVHAVAPHMHLLGTDMTMYAETPDGRADRPDPDRPLGLQLAAPVRPERARPPARRLGRQGDRPLRQLGGNNPQPAGRRARRGPLRRGDDRRDVLRLLRRHQGRPGPHPTATPTTSTSSSASNSTSSRRRCARSTSTGPPRRRADRPRSGDPTARRPPRCTGRPAGRARRGIRTRCWRPRCKQGGRRRGWPAHGPAARATARPGAPPRRSRRPPRWRTRTGRSSGRGSAAASRCTSRNSLIWKPPSCELVLHVEDGVGHLIEHRLRGPGSGPTTAARNLSGDRSAIGTWHRLAFAGRAVTIPDSPPSAAARRAGASTDASPAVRRASGRAGRRAIGGRRPTAGG